MTVENVDYKGNLAAANTDQTPSQNIWADCPWAEIERGEENGVCFFDTFLDLPLAPTLTTQIAFGKYKAFCDSGGTISVVSAINSVEKAGGFLQMTSDTNNEAASIAHAYPSLFLSGSPSTSGKLWFECRVALSAILTNGIGFFVGLAEVEQFTLAQGVPFNAGDPITADGSLIGFRKGEDALGVIDTVVSDRATSFTNIGASATSVAANTFIKLGLKYDPAETTNCIRFFANNLELTTKYSKSTLTGLTNLDANALGLMAAIIVDSAGTSDKFYMDWWKVAQVFPNQ